MTHEAYIQSLPDSQKQFATELIQELSTNKEVCVYHTDANGGDIRVRMANNGRVLFTMYWQSRNEVYFCRCFVETQYLDKQPGLLAVQLEERPEPLVSSFRFKPNYSNTMRVLTDLIAEAVKRHHFYLQNTER